MIVQQITSSNVDDLASQLSNDFKNKSFGLFFCSNKIMKDVMEKKVFANIECPIVGCSTSGEISENGVDDESIVLSLCQFQSDVAVRSSSVSISDYPDLKSAGKALGEKVHFEKMKAVLLFAVGVNVNGSEIVAGISEVVGTEIPVTGGLAGDNANFVETFVSLNGKTSKDMIVAIALGGEKLNVSFASQGGWQAFGPMRKITKAENNILYTIDGEPALDIYKTYLGDKVDELPGAGLLYPFAVESDPGEPPIIRTILGIDESNGSLILAGDVREGTELKLMHTGTEGLVEGAKIAAKQALEQNNGANGLAILVSCVGRKIVMGTDVDDEVDIIKDIFGDESTLTGFYSHGEICPHEKGKSARLHNQTMTITLITEAS